MEIVKLESSQINNILDLRRAQELEKNYDPKLIDEYLDLFQSWLNEHLNKDFIMFGALEKNKLISMYGGVILPRPNATVIYLGSAYTLPEYRGQGLLTELNEQLFTFALKNGINIAEASIDSSTPEAMNHLTREKMKAETNIHRYNILVNPDYRFEEQNDRLKMINKDTNKYVISNLELIEKLEQRNLEVSIVYNNKDEELVYKIKEVLNKIGYNPKFLNIKEIKEISVKETLILEKQKKYGFSEVALVILNNMNL